jgi:hypothetical protein
MENFTEIFRQNCDEKRKKNLRKINSILQTYCKALGCNGGKNLGSTKNQPKSMVDGQPVQHKIVRLLNVGLRADRLMTS